MLIFAGELVSIKAIPLDLLDAPSWPVAKPLLALDLLLAGRYPCDAGIG
jgi:hypothetical protein